MCDCGTGSGWCVYGCVHEYVFIHLCQSLTKVETHWKKCEVSGLPLSLSLLHTTSGCRCLPPSASNFFLCSSCVFCQVQPIHWAIHHWIVVLVFTHSKFDSIVCLFVAAVVAAAAARFVWLWFWADSSYAFACNAYAQRNWLKRKRMWHMHIANRIRLPAEKKIKEQRETTFNDCINTL